MGRRIGDQRVDGVLVRRSDGERRPAPAGDRVGRIPGAGTTGVGVPPDRGLGERAAAGEHGVSAHGIGPDGQVEAVRHGVDLRPRRPTVEAAVHPGSGGRVDPLAVVAAHDDVVDVIEARVGGVGQLRPRRAPVGRLEDPRAAHGVTVVDTFTRPCVENRRVPRIEGERHGGDVRHHVVERSPAGASVSRLPDAPGDGRGPHRRGVSRIDHDRSGAPADVAGTDLGPCRGEVVGPTAGFGTGPLVMRAELAGFPLGLDIPLSVDGSRLRFPTALRLLVHHRRPLEGEELLRLAGLS